ncbi:site-specific integrase (plasmid) [Vibrio vulnificus]|uniref:tyrosine-type recombinase/integrase n=1 Tax=Vibrio vulnificus TaxID=672 RepID=UPI0015FDDE6F|nr:site-specific integrase [Vibrio vulnificus]MCA0767838.1 site-specific integrase [Vibrio vulnificus]MCJ0823852.1 site-specific integrase [Vibrio vulnificus]QMV39736.1 site-specific integrase [Vibrio vulnificus]
MYKSKAKARSLTPHQINKVLKRCLLMSNPQLKRAALALSFSTLRVSEAAQIIVSDVLTPTGEIKTEIALRAALCKRRIPRVVWLSNQARTLLQEWFDYRKSKQWATTLSTEYQGLNPRSKVLLNQSGRSYSMKQKNRVNQQGETVTYIACDALELLIRNTFARCGLKGASSHSGRRSYGTNMNALGVELSAIQRALGHAEPSMSLEYIDVSGEQLSRAADLAF